MVVCGSAALEAFGQIFGFSSLQEHLICAVGLDPHKNRGNAGIGGIVDIRYRLGLEMLLKVLPSRKYITFAFRWCGQTL